MPGASLTLAVLCFAFAPGGVAIKVTVDREQLSTQVHMAQALERERAALMADPNLHFESEIQLTGNGQETFAPLNEEQLQYVEWMTQKVHAEEPNAWRQVEGAINSHGSAEMQRAKPWLKQIFEVPKTDIARAMATLSMSILSDPAAKAVMEQTAANLQSACPDFRGGCVVKELAVATPLFASQIGTKVRNSVNTSLFDGLIAEVMKKDCTPMPKPDGWDVGSVTEVIVGYEPWFVSDSGGKKQVIHLFTPDFEFSLGNMAYKRLIVGIQGKIPAAGINIRFRVWLDVANAYECMPVNGLLLAVGAGPSEAFKAPAGYQTHILLAALTPGAYSDKGSGFTLLPLMCDITVTPPEHKGAWFFMTISATLFSGMLELIGFTNWGGAPGGFVKWDPDNSSYSVLPVDWMVGHWIKERDGEIY